MVFFGALLLSATVVLDPGHGGSEAGAERNGLKEKSICLSIAQAAQSRLVERGHRVLLTRTTDQEVSLAARIGQAHQAGADVFVSIHVNASPVRGRRGVETYVASVLSEMETEALVFREERSSGSAAASKEAGVDGILFDLVNQSAHRRSARLAADIQAAVSAVRGAGPSRGLRQAPFFVLKAAQLPAALLEAGYLSHPEQAAFLATREGQKAVGIALARGVERFLAH